MAIIGDAKIGKATVYDLRFSHPACQIVCSFFLFCKLWQFSTRITMSTPLKSNASVDLNQNPFRSSIIASNRLNCRAQRQHSRFFRPIQYLLIILHLLDIVSGIISLIVFFWDRQIVFDYIHAHIFPNGEKFEESALTMAVVVTIIVSLIATTLSLHAICKEHFCSVVTFLVLGVFAFFSWISVAIASGESGRATFCFRVFRYTIYFIFACMLYRRSRRERNLSLVWLWLTNWRPWLS